eukprot:Sdes_comp18475_c0_seq2m8462
MWKLEETLHGIECFCLAIFDDKNLRCVNFASGDFLIVGKSNGVVNFVDISAEIKNCESFAAEPPKNPTFFALKKEKSFHTKHSTCIDFISQITNNKHQPDPQPHRFVSQSTDQKIFIWSFSSLSCPLEIRLRKSCELVTFSRFSLDQNAHFLSIGSSQGTIQIHHLETGNFVAELQHPKVKSPISASLLLSAPLQCAPNSLLAEAPAEAPEMLLALSETNIRQCIFATRDGFLFRYDYVSSAELSDWE